MAQFVTVIIDLTRIPGTAIYTGQVVLVAVVLLYIWRLAGHLLGRAVC